MTFLKIAVVAFYLDCDVLALQLNAKFVLFSVLHFSHSHSTFEQVPLQRGAVKTVSAFT